MSDHLREVLQLLRHGQDPRLAGARVETSPSADQPGLTAYRISGGRKAIVQAAIDALSEIAEEHAHGGFAQFLHPWPDQDGVWRSRGEVMLYQPEGTS